VVILSLILSSFFALAPFHPAMGLAVEAPGTGQDGAEASGPAGATPDAQSAGTVLLSRYLFDDLAAATVTVEPAVRGKDPVADGDNFQPFHHSRAPRELRRFHRRVILHDRSRAFREMREGMVLPVPSRLDFPVKPTAGAVVVFSSLALGDKGKLEVTVSCDAPNASVLWEDTLDSAPVKSIRTWPAWKSAALPPDCARVSFAAASADGKPAGGLRVAWDSLRVDVATPVGQAPLYNVVYVVVDALRSDAVGVRRTAFESVSPAMDAFEKSGTTFPDGYSNGNTTLLSMNAMLLGAHPRAMGFLTLWWGGQDRRPFFYERKPTFITRLLHDAGYYTFGAVHNHLFFPGYVYGVDPGFDALQDCGRDTTDHTILTEQTIQFMRENRDRRFLVELNLLGPHQPYAPPPEYLDAVKAKLGKQKDLLLDLRYLGEVAWVDLHVDMLLKALSDLGLRENTLVVLTADHGEVMDQKHSCFSQREQHACFHLHGLTLYEEEINVPIMFSLPGVVKAGQVAPDFAQHVDIVPTVLDLVGVPLDPRFTGRSLKPVLLEGKRLAEVPVYSEKWLARAVRKGNMKVIHHSAKDDICPPSASKVCKAGDWFEMYDLSTDPHERNEISRSQPDRARQLVKELLQFKAELQSRASKGDPNP